ncbi:UDP-N-acetylmuramoyl-tripeptide--D-alanyl-D-alanine ligase [Nocardioides gansuensis]|uniref:UDP-N-acetylmuramoyl-tripeptide--D-alanyl-D-alanine ligase n=1 Tax=Nocardioides gansuensis TaxID=2138300 RepID=A0A2T8FAP8_9ACTN|nr:UDP-N-acetylmuramoyl-tripeptide--D-alanyl-D-alanine ligase [Nocardioides gansuensis]PVG82799.1 UDP-N-acetylmuramoyl-tripeptide--D-alanyl-D-alanine ligase [Nocardioides gansuensis]
MIEMTLAEVAEVVGGLAHGDAVVTAPAFVDSRLAVPGGLFVAIAGEHVDGHDFADRAVEAGAAAVLCSRPVDGPCVVVDDVVAALGRLARQVVDRLPEVTVFALTGSQGKTGVKDYLAAVLEAAGPTVATAGNFNNEIGVPLTVLRATQETRHLVVEMGARGLGHISYLCSIAPPDVAAVLNVGSAHLGEFGSRQAIAQAKGEIVEALPAGGTAVLNADDPLVAAMADRTAARVRTVGLAEDADLRWEIVDTDDLGRPEVGYRSEDASARVRLPLPGAHQAVNAGMALGMALAVGVPLGEAAESLAAARPASHWRMELTERPDGLLVVNDAYNANPESMTAALETLRVIGERRGRRTVAVLGEMRELGVDSTAGHRRVGDVVAAAAIDVLLTVGDVAADIAHAAREHPDWGGEAIVTVGRAEAVEWLRHNVSAADVVLVKASRGAALELVADALLTEEEGSSTP